MASQSTRYEIVIRALTLGGRDVSIRSEAEQWLNDILGSWALEYKFQTLRKIGSAITLPAGQSTVAVPSDLGAGSDNLLFGSDRTPIYERDMDEFVQAGGFSESTGSSGRPNAYCIVTDSSNEKVFKFNCAADTGYSFIPVYYYRPAQIPQDSSGDTQKIWIDSDDLIVQALIERIYQYTGDQRETLQASRVMSMMANYRRGSAPMGGGSSKITLSRTRFK